MDSISKQAMRDLAEKYKMEGKVLDVGSRDINGNFRDIFKDYTGSDIVAGDNVDVVQTSPLALPFPDGTFDTVVSGQMLEHCKNPFKIFGEMVRVLKTGGHLAITVPWKMGHHPCPIDCWRFSPDGMSCLAEGLPLEILENRFSDIYHEREEGVVFVARKL
jgi:SAM-dependent methyltransferase